MANKTANHATQIHGTNPQYLVEAITRKRIYDSKYWKKECLLLNSAEILEKAVDDLRFIGGVYGNTKPAPFLCLVLKLLQIQPKRDIIYLYIDQPDFKYLRALGAFYLRLVGSPTEVYTKLEPLYKDYRKLRIIDTAHNFSIIYMDEFIDDLLREERVFNMSLPRLTKRIFLEENGDIKPYKSELEDLNLIPTQIIEERLEKQFAERDRRHRSYKDSNEKYFRHDARDSDSDGSDDLKSPVKGRSYQTTTIKGRFRKEEIDHENSIREKLGLKPLR